MIGLLGVQVLLAILLLARRGEGTVVKEQPLLPGFDVAQVTRMQVTADGKAPIDLVKKGAGWVIASSFDYPADTARVDGVLAPIAKLTAAEPIATQVGRQKQLEVADDKYQRKVVITANGKDTTLY